MLDIGLGVATVGGMALPAAIRTFGSSATEAAMSGADLDQQMLYATTSAAASYGIEYMCNVAFAGLNLIAPGVSDDIVTAGVEQLAQKLASTPKGAQALTNIGMLIASGASEGEVLGAMAVFEMERQETAVITDGSHLQDGQLKPNVTYKTGEHDYIYQTNENGLISCVIANDLQFKTHDSSFWDWVSKTWKNLTQLVQSITGPFRRS